jgi:protoporphyrinogen oxidase
MDSFFVVGGGLAGLAAANALAGPDRNVTLIEQSETLGGRARTVEDCGYSLNFGPHALYRCGRTFRTLESWGIPIHATAPVLKGGAYLARGDEKFPFVRDVVGLAQSPMLRAVDKVRAGRALASLTGAVEEDESAADWITRHGSSPPVIDFLSAVFRVSTYAADLTQLSARAALEQLRISREGGVLYVDGGWQSMIDALEKRALSLGVEIRRGSPVRGLETLKGEGVILAVPPDQVSRLTGVAIPSLVPSQMACLTLGLSRLPEGSSLFALSMDQPLYLSVHSHWAKVAPEGRALVHLGKYLTAEASDAASDRRELEAFATRHLPGWRDCAEVAQFLPSMIVTHALDGLRGRPDVDALGRERILIAGDWVGPEGMLGDAATSSGLRAAALLLSLQ